MHATADFRPSLWRRCAAVMRLCCVCVLTLFVALSLSIGRLALGAEAKRRWRVLHFNVWSRGVCRLLGGRTNIVGTPPAAPFFLVSNHLSYLDILVLAQYLPCRFVAKSDVARWPVVGYLTRIADTLYINRTRRADIPRANAAIHNALLSGDSVALFPEGTSSNSDWALPIKAPLLQVAADNGIDVHTAAIRYDTHPSDIPAQASICYFGDDVFGQHIWRLFHLRGFTTTLRFCEQPVSGSDRKTLAANVEDSIHSLQALTNEKSESLSPDTFNNRSASHSSL